MKRLSEILKLRGTYIFCPRCGSPAVTHTRPKVDSNANLRTEVYSVTCSTCGLRGNVEENWLWEEQK